MLNTINDRPALFPHQKNTLSTDDIKNWGTFKDSLRAPVHRWFTYPAGFSFKAVEHSFERFDIKKGMKIYDPFMGSGTTNLVAKCNGINSVGVEAHPFVFDITNAKFNWELDFSNIEEFLSDLESEFDKIYVKTTASKKFNLESYFPELVLKCYSAKTLTKLLIIRNYYDTYDLGDKEKNFLFVSITALLRVISSAATGWPYIAPKKAKVTSEDKDALVELIKIVNRMIEDVKIMKKNALPTYVDSNHKLILGSSTNVKEYISDNSIDHIFTSPPYLNNFDYSDRTRLELYFWGIANTWKDISDNFRTKLMTSATTQILRSDPKYVLSDEFKKTCPIITEFLTNSVAELGELRKVKGGKKSYDLMVVGYFNDIFEIIKECYRVLKPNTKALFILGDSAPYGVHIPTDKLIGEIGCCLGFDNFTIEVLRKRGDKWKSNPQRHNVSLQESIVILEKKN